MPAWLLEFLLGQIVKWVVSKYGHSEASNKVAIALSNAALLTDSNPPPLQANDPHKRDAAHGGLE